MVPFDTGSTATIAWTPSPPISLWLPFSRTGGTGLLRRKSPVPLYAPLEGGIAWWPIDKHHCYKRTINYAFSIAKVFHAHSCIADGQHHMCFVSMRQERRSRQRSSKNHLRHQLYWVTLFLRAKERQSISDHLIIIRATTYTKDYHGPSTAEGTTFPSFYTTECPRQHRHYVRPQ